MSLSIAPCRADDGHHEPLLFRAVREGTHYSPDGRWYWDGARWLPVVALSGYSPPPRYRSARLLGHWTVGLLAGTAGTTGLCLIVFGLDTIGLLSPPDTDLEGGAAVL